MMEYDRSKTEPASVAVVRAVSSMKGVEPSALEPLAETTDPKALDDLAASHCEGTERGTSGISFHYEGYHIGIQNGEHITVKPSGQGFHHGRSQPV